MPHLFGVAVLSAGEWPVASSLAILRASAFLVALAGACVLCCNWWITRNPGSAWLGAAVMALAITQLPSALLELDGATATAMRTPYTVLDSILALPFVAVLAVGATSRTFKRRITPIVLGGVLGLALGTVHLLAKVLDLEEVLNVDGAPLWVDVGAAVAIGLLVALVIRRFDSLPSWARKETILAAVAITCGRLAHREELGDSTLWDVAASAIVLAGFLLFVSTAVELLREGIGDRERQLSRTLERAESAERTHHHDEETLHELRGAVAGVGSAARILAGMSDALSPTQQIKLSEQMSFEMERLERLLTGEREAPGQVALDPLLSSLVAAYGSFGVAIDAIPTEASAWTVATDLTDVLHVLINNTTRHAPGSTATVWVSTRPDRIDLHVSDDGPGIAPALRSRVFDRGTHNGSGGQGLGLFIARRILAEHGARIDLVDEPTGRTTFVVGLPVKEPA